MFDLTAKNNSASGHKLNLAKHTKIPTYKHQILHDCVIKWKHFSRYRPFVRGIHRWPVNCPHQGQWRGALVFSLIWAWTNGWVNNRDAGDLRHHRAHYEVHVMDLFFATFTGELWGVRVCCGNIGENGVIVLRLRRQSENQSGHVSQIARCSQKAVKMANVRGWDKTAAVTRNSSRTYFTRYFAPLTHWPQKAKCVGPNLKVSQHFLALIAI